MQPVDSPHSIASGEQEKLDYWRETRRPFCNLVFLFPMLLVYEIGIGWIGGVEGSIRNGADAWLRFWLHQSGFSTIWLPPVLLIGTLLTCHMVSRQPWKMAWDTYGGMAAESLLYAFVLIMIGQMTDYGFRHATWARLEVETPSVTHGSLIRFVTFMGAGIYEEFLFRLCLLSLTYAAFRGLLFPKNWAIAGTIVTSSVVFALAHYLNPSSGGDLPTLLVDAVARVQSNRELWFSFAFRTLAGVFFAGLYFLRGFGITVGVHATYDIVVGVVLVQEI